jgi:hypothetical protein
MQNTDPRETRMADADRDRYDDNPDGAPVDPAIDPDLDPHNFVIQDEPRTRNR